MVHVEFRSFDLALDDKRAVARILTECLASALALTDDERELCSVSFVPYRAEDVAIAGRLAHDGKGTDDGKSPLYLLDVAHAKIPRRDRKRLMKAFTDQLVRHLDLGTEAQRRKLRVVFREIDPRDVAIGGVWLSSTIKQRVRATRPQQAEGALAEDDPATP